MPAPLSLEDRLLALSKQNSQLLITEQTESTPNDPVDTQLLKLRQQLRDNVPMDDTAPVDEDADGGVRKAFMGLLRGTNRAIAKGIAIPEKLVDELGGLAQKAVGSDKLAGMPIGGGQGQAAIQQKYDRVFEALGIDVSQRGEFAEKLGEEGVKGAVEAGIMIAAAPVAAAKTGAGVVSILIRNFGELTKKYPGLTFLQGIGGSVGAEVGNEIGGPLGVIPGAIAGGVTADLAGRGVAAAGRKATGAVKGLFSGPQPTIAPLRDPGTEVAPIKQFAEQQIEGATLQIENAIQSAIQRIPTTGDPGTVQRRVAKLFDRAEAIADDIVDKFWKRTPLKTQVPGSSATRQIDQMAFELNQRNATSEIPEEFMYRLKNLWMPTRGADGRMQKAMPTIERLRAERRDIYRARRDEEAANVRGFEPNRGKIANLARLEGIIDDAIEAAVPGDVTIKQARQMSIKVHDLFTRSRLRTLQVRNRTGAPGTRPEETVEDLMAANGMDDLLSMTKKLSTVPRIRGQKDAYPHVTTPAQKAELKALEAETENAIRSMFRESVAQDGPEAIGKFMRKWEPKFRPLARVSAELEQASNQVKGLMEQKEVIQKSALARFSQADAEKAIQGLWGHKDPVGQGKDLMRTFQGDANALEGLRAGLVDQLFRSTGGDPLRLANTFRTDRFNRLLSTVLDPDQFNRLNKIINSAEFLTKNPRNISWKDAIMPGSTILGRILGAAMGRSFSQMLGAQGTLQGPALMANAGARAVERLLKTADPMTLMRFAVTDHKWEKVLMSRMPTDQAGIAKLGKQVRRLFNGLQGGLNIYKNYGVEEDVVE